MDDDKEKGMNVVPNSYGKQYVNSGDGQQFNYNTMSGTQNFNLVMRQKLDFSFVRPVGLCLDQAPYIESSLFVGRATEISQIHKILRPGIGVQEQRRVVLGGMGGIGKTQLAIAYAESDYNACDSILWFNATSEATLKTSFKSMAERIFDVEDLSTLSSKQVVAGMKQWLADRKNMNWLLVFDNYDEPQTYSLDAYYPRTSHGAVIITTRLPDEVGTETLMLRSLGDIEDGLKILERRSKRENVKHDIHARRLAERLAGLPLALVTAGAFLHVDKSMWTFERYLFEYEKRWNIDPWNHLRLNDYQNRTLYTTWTLSYEHLQARHPVAAQMLKLLAYFGHQSLWYELFESGRSNDVADWLLAATADSFNFDGLMRVLVNYCFIEVQSSDQAYGMHTCVHDWALAGLNVHVESWCYWYAFDCMSKSIDNIEWEVLGYLQFARYVPHAIRLTHAKFAEIFHQIREDQITAAERIARLLREQIQFAAAELIQQRVLLCKETALGPNDMSTLDTVSQLGILYTGQDKLDQAEMMHLRALAGRETALGVNHTSTLLTVNSLGLVYDGQGKYKKAEVMFLRAIAGQEAEVGGDHLSILAAVHNLGTVYAHQGKLDEAEREYERARAGYEITLGANHVSTLHTIVNLGGLYRDQGKLEGAEMMYAQALAGYKKALGADHISTLLAVNNLGILYYDQRKLDEAEAMYVQAQTGYEKTLGVNHTSALDVVHNLGALYAVQGKLEKAEVMYSRALAGREKTLGRDHPSTLDTVHNFGTLYDEQGKLDEAEAMYMRALSGLRSKLGVNHASTLKTVKDLAKVLQKRIKPVAGEPRSISRLARLVQHVDEWGRNDPTMLNMLANALLSFDDDTNAGVALVQSMRLNDSTLTDFRDIKCTRCTQEITLARGRHILGTTYNLCNACQT